MVKSKIGTDLMLSKVVDECKNGGALIEVETPGKKILGVGLAELMYDKESDRIVRELFSHGSSFLPSEIVKIKKNCIAPDHDDSNPSMEVSFIPMYWRKSTKVSSHLSAEEDRKLEEMYYHGVLGNSTTINNNNNNNNNIKDIILYVCRAKCYSSNCGFSSILRNDQIKLLK